MDHIVTVNLNILALTPGQDHIYRPPYAILINRTAAEILQFARDYKRCFVFSFYTGAPETCPDYSSLLDLSGLEADYVYRPLAIGNLTSEGNVIQQWVELAFERCGGPAYCQPDCIWDDRTKHDDIDYIGTMIDACGTAVEIAEVGAKLQQLIDHLSIDPADQSLPLLVSAYNNIRRAACYRAGVETALADTPAADKAIRSSLPEV